jgi:hypothetical protein
MIRGKFDVKRALKNNNPGIIRDVKFFPWQETGLVVITEHRKKTNKVITLYEPSDKNYKTMVKDKTLQ